MSKETRASRTQHVTINNRCRDTDTISVHWTRTLPITAPASRIGDRAAPSSETRCRPSQEAGAG
eukprot:12391404-Alexandrium_andersonii.AAC.1